jgi:Thioredoxin reductase
MTEYDMIVIGGGPVGLFGTFYAGLRDMKALLIDVQDELGGQLVTLYPEKMVYDVGRVPWNTSVRVSAKAGRAGEDVRAEHQTERMGRHD